MPESAANSEAIAEAMLALLEQRRPGATACPSEVARALCPLAEDWRALMPQVREAAAQLADAGLVQVTQRGVVVDARSARGAIRLRRVPGSGPPSPAASANASPAAPFSGLVDNQADDSADQSS